MSEHIRLPPYPFGTVPEQLQDTTLQSKKSAAESLVGARSCVHSFMSQYQQYCCHAHALTESGQSGAAVPVGVCLKGCAVQFVLLLTFADRFAYTVPFDTCRVVLPGTWTTLIRWRRACS